MSGDMKGIHFMERFEMQHIPVTECGCWLWLGSPDKDGYGYIQIGKKRPKAHRFSYETWIGPIPKGMSVLHKCDLTCCVNPDHLFLGTQKDNMQDKKKKGRAPRGAQIPNAKLDENKIHEILLALDQGESQYAIASRFSITQGHVSAIKAGKRWSHIQRKSLI